MSAIRPELSRPIGLDVGPDPRRAVEVVADTGERAALARRFELLALPSLAATLAIERTRGGRTVLVRGRIVARATQTCVVSLDPVETELDVPIERCFAPEAGPFDCATADPLVDPEALDVEPLEGQILDLGEVVAEELGLALDSYPHKAGAYGALDGLGEAVSFEIGGEEMSPAAPGRKAFAGLAGLRERLS